MGFDQDEVRADTDKLDSAWYIDLFDNAACLSTEYQDVAHMQEVAISCYYEATTRRQV